MFIDGDRKAAERHNIAVDTVSGTGGELSLIPFLNRAPQIVCPAITRVLQGYCDWVDYDAIIIEWLAESAASGQRGGEG